jgi:hypothetical protein
VTGGVGWVPRHVSDLEMVTLRGWVTGDAGAARGALSEQLASGGDVNGLGVLFYAAFVTAARHMFAPRYSDADVIGYVARLRAELSQADDPGSCWTR